MHVVSLQCFLIYQQGVSHGGRIILSAITVVLCTKSLLCVVYRKIPTIEAWQYIITNKLDFLNAYILIKKEL